MKHNALSLTSLFFVLPLMLAACGGAAVPADIPTEAQPVIETPAPSSTPEPTQAPLPCIIAFDTDRDGNREIYRMEPDGSRILNLSNHPAEDVRPAWSPDGSRIAFVSNRENATGGGQLIYVMDADGGNVRSLPAQKDSDFPNWSNDGSRITYTHSGDIYVVSADGSGQPVNLTNSPEEDSRSAWSRDDSLIAWISDSGNGNRNIFVMQSDGGNVKQLTDNGQMDGFLWTVDGRIFSGWGWNDLEQFCHNCVMNADGSNIEDAGGKGELQRIMPYWTADGQRVEVGNVDFFTGDNEIYLVGEIYPDMFLNLTNNPADDRNPVWPALCGPRGSSANP